METLLSSIDGAYRVTTTASTHLIDLDRMVIRRQPRTVDPQAELLRRDDELIELLAVGECTVGKPMVLHVDLHIVGVSYTTRTSAPVVSIERVPSPGTDFRR